MQRADSRAIRFVRALLPDRSVAAAGDTFAIGDIRLPANKVRELISAGILAGDSMRCGPTREARTWLKRVLLDAEAFAAQHRIEVPTNDAATLNLAESPLSRLAVSLNGQPPFLARHQIEAGERVRRLAERAQLQPRLTTSYSAAHTAGRKGSPHTADISDMAAEARKELAEISRVLPHDCADVVLDVCGLLKGLQTVEVEHNWPRRSAKLVLRIGLDQLAQHYGLSPLAIGAPSRRKHRWLGEGAKPREFG
jgi:hypothetical protein